MLHSSASERNKATNNDSLNGRGSDDTTIISHRLPLLISTQQEASPDFDEIQSLDFDAENLFSNGLRQRVWRQVNLRRQWQRLSLKTKVTALAIVISTIPVLGSGVVAHYFADKSITQQIIDIKAARAFGLADKTNRFMFERYADLQTLADMPIFTNPKLRAVTTGQEINAILDHHVDTHNSYDSIALLDLKDLTLI